MLKNKPIWKYALIIIHTNLLNMQIKKVFYLFNYLSTCLSICLSISLSLSIFLSIYTNDFLMQIEISTYYNFLFKAMISNFLYILLIGHFRYKLLNNLLLVYNLIDFYVLVYIWFNIPLLFTKFIF